MTTARRLSPDSTEAAVPAQEARDAVSPRDRLTDDLLEQASAADEVERRRLLDEVVLLNLPVARGLAARYRDRGESMDDLVQVASLALVKAARGYEPGKGRGFLPYAVPTITGELRRHFRDRGWDVRPPRRVQELRLSVASAAHQLAQEIGHSPTVAELAQHLQVGEEEVIETLAAAQGYSATSLDAPCDGDDGAPLGETLSCEDESIDRVVDGLAVEPLLATLPPRDRHILCLRFYRGWTQSQIAEEIGVTQMQVSRLLSRALARLREQVLADPA
jgi:RNA polymerase sigma-B factor